MEDKIYIVALLNPSAKELLMVMLKSDFTATHAQRLPDFISTTILTVSSEHDRVRVLDHLLWNG